MSALETIVAQRHGLLAPDASSQARNAEQRLQQLPEDEDLAALIRELQGKYGSSIKAVLLYGSYTRGERDSLVDLYVLLDGYPDSVRKIHAFANKVLPPNVYQLQASTGVRCKYALLPMRQFVRRLESDFHSYFWARFAQPCQVLFVSDPVSASTLRDGLAAGVRRFLSEAAAYMIADGQDLHQPPGQELALWQQGLTLTYACELRAEGSRRPGLLVESHQAYFGELAETFLASEASQTLQGASRRALMRWRLRKGWGKALSVLRLIKAAFTFNDGFDYLLWKIERHSGIYVEPTPAQRKAPLLLAWPLFWRLYRLGAFR